MDELHNAGRRRILVNTGGLLALSGLGGMARADSAGEKHFKPEDVKPLPEYTDWKHAESMIVHSPNTIELKRDAFGNSVLTPTDRLFVRNNLSPPSAEIVKDPDAWSLEVSGVKNPRSFTVAELKTLGVEALPMVLQCSGNGRAWFPHNPSGTQWTVGAAGCVIFTGVPVKAVLEAVGGMEEGMVYMTSTGGEEIPEGLDPDSVKVERSVPAEAMEHAILAWELNGEPLQLAHGGPLRIVIPGYTGVNSIKYVKQLAFTKEQSSARIQQNSYRFSPVGVSGTPEHDSIWEMPVKSWITAPLDTDGSIKAGRVQITGVAMGGMTAAKSVEVSTDGGKRWHEAKFVGPDLGPYAWRQFVYSADLPAGRYELASRATNDDGDTQPAERAENNRGYINNGWQDHMVTVTVA